MDPPSVPLVPLGTFLATNPLAIFALLLVLSVVVPPLVRPLRLPDLVGLLLAGVAIGPHGLAWLESSNETVRLLSDVGVIYLLFIAGLEIDLGTFRRTRSRSLRFGLLTFSLPMVAGTALGFAYGYPAVSAVLIGSIIASHTPLGYPIVRSFGAMGEECVTVAIGGTIFTDIAALVVLALCISLGQDQLNGAGVIALLLKVALYAAAVLLLIRQLGRGLIRRNVDGDSRLFVAVLLALFLAALGAKLAGVEMIVGAFLAGLAVNGILPEGRVKEQVVVVGAGLFIPLFFIDLGLLLDVPVFLSTMTGSVFAIALILTLITSKGLASWWSGLLYRYDGPQMLTLWSLSLPQVAATLAATYVGFREGLLDGRMLNSVLALMVVTATLGPILTSVAMTRMASRRARDLSLQESGQLALVRRALRVLVPISEARSEEPLLALAARLIDGEAGRQGVVMPLAVVSPRQAEAGRGAQPLVHRDLAKGRQLQARADACTAALGVPSRSLLRVDNDIPAGIASTALEQGADLVLVNVVPEPWLGRWLFGDPVAALCRQALCPVVMASLQEDPSSFRRLLVPVKDLSAGSLEQFQLAERLLSACAPEDGAAITLLHIHGPWLPQAEQVHLARQLQDWIPSGARHKGGVPVTVELLADPNVLQAIEHISAGHDLVILRSLRRLVEGVPIPASDQATGLLRRLRCSVLVISDPLH